MFINFTISDFPYIFSHLNECLQTIMIIYEFLSFSYYSQLLAAAFFIFDLVYLFYFNLNYLNLEWAG